MFTSSTKIALIIFLHIAIASADSSPSIHRIKLKKTRSRYESRFGASENYISNQDDKEGLNNIFEVRYIGDVSIGTPPQKFSIMFDTGSSSMWVHSQGCTNCGNGCKLYSGKDSTTYTPSTKSFEASYGIGHVSGVVAEDDVIISGIKVTGQSFGAIHSQQKQGCNLRMNGLIGLAFPALSVDGLTTLFQNMISQNLIQQQIFSFYLSSNENENDKDGELLFGGIDHSLYTGNVTYADVTHDNYWRFNLDRIKESDVCDGGCYAIADTGTSFVAVPEMAFHTFMKLFGDYSKFGENTYTVDCDRLSSLPTVTFIVQNVEFELTSKDYVLRRKLGLEKQVHCVLGFMPTTLKGIDGNDLWILGDVFLRKYYSIYDYGNKRVGLARAVRGKSSSLYHKSCIVTVFVFCLTTLSILN